MEPDWRPLASLRANRISPQLKHWLSDPASLTEKLIAACRPECFRVELLGQYWQRPLYSEQKLMAMRSGETAFIREVELFCADEAWVFARTLIPAGSFRGKARRLAHLGNRPLGAVLFAEPSTQRGCMQVARLLPGHPLFQVAVKNLRETPDELWGRRTLFYYAHQPLLVNEIFLPGITT